MQNSLEFTELRLNRQTGASILVPRGFSFPNMAAENKKTLGTMLPATLQKMIIRMCLLEVGKVVM